MPSFRTSVAPNSRTQIALTGRGLIAETFPAINTAASTYASQQLQATVIGLRGGDVITNVVVGVAVAASGTSSTGVYVGLYDTSFNRLAQSSNLSASSIWLTTGYAVAPLSAPYTITADGAYYVALVVDGAWGTQQLQVAKASPNIAANTMSAGIGSAARLGMIQTGQATLPTTITPAAASSFFWFGVN